MKLISPANIHTLTGGLILALGLGVSSAALAEGYTPPAPLGAVGALMAQSGDNGYGLGALITSQQDPPTSGEAARHTPTSAAAQAIRRAVAAEQQVRSLQTKLNILQARQEKEEALSTELVELKARLATSESAVAKLEAKHPAVALAAPENKQAYVVGQSIASNVRERLTSYANIGIVLPREVVVAGIYDGLSGTMQLGKTEMDKVYRQIAHQLQKGIDDKVSAGEKQIEKALKDKQLAKEMNGIRYAVIKKGETVSDPDTPVTLALTESILADGQILSNIPTLTLSPDEDMPPVIREALPLLGKGTEIKAWALARAVYGTLPLPKGVEPYTVLAYEIKRIDGSSGK